jgi:uncharacterized protein (UPF0548 family)
MISLTRPSPARIRAYIDSRRELPLTYADIGITARAGALPAELRARYRVDDYRIELGQGAECFARACDALERWAMFRIDFAELCSPDVKPEPGAVVGILAHGGGLWSVSCARVLSTLRESGAVERHGFTYGTLPGHAASGEERFSIEWQREADDRVCYCVRAFSRPGHWLTWVGRPVLRSLQRRFQGASTRAMLESVRGAGAPRAS